MKLEPGVDRPTGRQYVVGLLIILVLGLLLYGGLRWRARHARRADARPANVALKLTGAATDARFARNYETQPAA